MKNKPIIDEKKVLMAIRKAIKNKTEEKNITVTYLDNQGNIKKFKSKIK